ncbi:hypothetical protein Tco_1484854 [Tanacetum coccineum]
MKRQSFILSSIIPGEKAPGNDIDQHFKLKASLMWTINDFPDMTRFSQRAGSTRVVGMFGWKTKDNENTRKDLEEMGIRHDLHLINRPNGKPYLPPACYTMSPVEKSNFLQLLKDLKVPDGYSSNILRGVSLKDHKISNLKSHDGHILMQDVLPIALRHQFISITNQSRLVKA